MVVMHGALFVASVPFTFYKTTQIAVINTSTAMVTGSVEGFERWGEVALFMKRFSVVFVKEF